MVGYNTLTMHVCQKCHAFVFSNTKKHECVNAYKHKFSCPRCGRGFGYQKDVVRHLTKSIKVCGKNWGLTPKPYPCIYCGRKFTRARDIKRHIAESCPGTREKEDTTGNHLTLQIDEDELEPCYRLNPYKKKDKAK